MAAGVVVSAALQPVACVADAACQPGFTACHHCNEPNCTACRHCAAAITCGPACGPGSPAAAPPAAAPPRRPLLAKPCTGGSVKGGAGQVCLCWAAESSLLLVRVSPGAPPNHPCCAAALVLPLPADHGCQHRYIVTGALGCRRCHARRRQRLAGPRHEEHQARCRQVPHAPLQPQRDQAAGQLETLPALCRLCLPGSRFLAPQFTKLHLL